MGTRPQLTPQKVEQINRHVASLTPQFVQLFSMLHDADVHDFEIDVGTDKLIWRDPRIALQSPTQAQLTDELTAILDAHYPPFNAFSFMGMIWNPNHPVAEEMAKIVAMYRKRDREQVESQIIALLAAFKQSS